MYNYPNYLGHYVTEGARALLETRFSTARKIKGNDRIAWPA